MPQAPEQRWLKHIEPSEAAQTLREYNTLLPQLAPEIERYGARLRALRESGTPSDPEYQRIHADIVRSLERTTDLRQRLNELAFGETDAPEETVRAAVAARDAHESEFDAAETVFNSVLREDAQWTAQQAEAGKYGRRAGDYGVQEVGRITPLEMYDHKVAELIQEVGMLEWAFEYSLQGALTREKLEKFHEGLTGAYERLSDMDDQTPDHEQSEERRALIMLIRQLKERYPLSMVQVGPPVAASAPGPEMLGAAFAARQRAIASYAAVSHRLPLEQRQYFRQRIAKLTLQVDHAAEAAWRDVVAEALRTRQSSPRTGTDVAREAVQLNMMRATLAAHPIADSVLGTMRTRKGMFGALTGIFRLK